ncbi:winged helix-turn-helix transcriptional regulator [Cronobacter sakazakii]|nr:winged helix-turn-helix transcriptional regulator [Cronobacter sakazakii]
MVFSFVSVGCCGTLSPKLTFSKYVQKGKYEMTRSTLSEQLRDGNLFAEECPSRDVLKHVTSRWGVLILVALRDGTHRFSDLRRKMGGVSEKMLAQSLQALEQDGFVDRVSYPVVPPHVEYSLTPLGVEVSEKVAALADWIEVNLPQVLANRGEQAA